MFFSSQVSGLAKLWAFIKSHSYMYRYSRQRGPVWCEVGGNGTNNFQKFIR